MDYALLKALNTVSTNPGPSLRQLVRHHLINKKGAELEQALQKLFPNSYFFDLPDYGLVSVICRPDMTVHELSHRSSYMAIVSDRFDIRKERITNAFPFDVLPGIIQVMNIMCQ